MTVREASLIKGDKVAIDENTDVTGDAPPISLCEGFETLLQRFVDNDLNGWDAHLILLLILIVGQ
jgi:hypothetical protein